MRRPGRIYRPPGVDALTWKTQMGLAGVPPTGQETLWAVIVGAVLATIGGFAATQFETVMRKRDRQRSAALLFGEILSSVEIIAEMAVEARGRGDPYGAYTLRLLRMAKRETEAYDKNRESLYDIRKAKVRAQIHTLMVRLEVALEGVFDASSDIARAQAALENPDLDQYRRAELTERIEFLQNARDVAFDYVTLGATDAKAVISGLRPLARQTFEAHRAVSRDI